MLSKANLFELRYLKRIKKSDMNGIITNSRSQTFKILTDNFIGGGMHAEVKGEIHRARLTNDSDFSQK